MGRNDQGLPIAVQVVGPLHSEDELLHLDLLSIRSNFGQRMGAIERLEHEPSRSTSDTLCDENNPTSHL